MEDSSLSKYTVSFGLSLALASVVNGLLVVAKEKIPAVQKGMQKMTGNHWVTHVAIVLSVFVLCGWLFGLANGGQGIKMTASHLIRAIVAGVAAGGLIILGFYLIGN